MHCSEFHEWLIHLNRTHDEFYGPYTSVPDPQNFSNFLKMWDLLRPWVVSHYTDTHLYVFSLPLALPVVINTIRRFPGFYNPTSNIFDTGRSPHRSFSSQDQSKVGPYLPKLSEIVLKRKKKKRTKKMRGGWLKGHTVDHSQSVNSQSVQGDHPVKGDPSVCTLNALSNPVCQWRGDRFSETYSIL
jgi:hypothetical protein